MKATEAQMNFIRNLRYTIEVKDKSEAQEIIYWIHAMKLHPELVMEFKVENLQMLKNLGFFDHYSQPQVNLSFVNGKFKELMDNFLKDKGSVKTNIEEQDKRLCSDENKIEMKIDGGITKREYFSGLAMQFLIEINPPKDAAWQAIQYADALIDELSK